MVSLGASVDETPGGQMTAAPRQEVILERIRRDGGVRVTDLVESLLAPDMTGRLDLDALESRGPDGEEHGCAVAVEAARTAEPGFEAKSARQEHEKQAIARATAELVEPHSAIGLSAGTTTAAVAEHLVDIPGLTVVTNSLHVAEVFHRSDRSDR